MAKGAERLTDSTYLALEYPPAAEDAPRFGWGKPAHARLNEILAARDAQYADVLRGFLTFEESLLRIGTEPTATEPGWIQHPAWMLGLDGVSLYGFVRSRGPGQYLEIGSGNSTKFVARARRDGALDTRITSIDPHPRAEIDELCDRVIRSPLESADLSVFEGLESGDVVFFDGSHRAFMNSDAVVFFTEILPSLPSGVLVGVHDILLPWDYPPQWGARYYSEQYLLACYLLAEGSFVTPVLPCHYVSVKPELDAILAPLWGNDRMRGVDTRGFTCWLLTHELERGGIS
ncbi:MAG TPA: class I SAM-dependent methyltransferase [Solirubrobacteraceae bacterium]|nr:class I SAM-dependent methyltransferase [Solirubrobacteraceae bacterium]